MIDYTLYFVFGFALGIVVAIFIYTAYLKKKKSTAKEVIDNAENQVEQIKKEKLFKFREEMQQKRLKFQEEFKQKENQLSRNESKIQGQEKELRRLENNLKFRESRLGQRNKKILQREDILVQKQNKLDEIIDEQNTKLEQIAGINVEDAKKDLLKKA